MKVGQAMSIFEAALPEDVAAPYRATLTRLQEQAPALPAIASTRCSWRTSASSGDASSLPSTTPPRRPRASVRSIGPSGGTAAPSPSRSSTQVRTRRCSRTCATPPDLARLMTAWVPGLDVRPLLDELAARVSEELDYEAEALSQRAFATVYRDDPRSSCRTSSRGDRRPSSRTGCRGYRCRRSSRRAPASSGIPPGSSTSASCSPGPARAGLLHADPHPGNFRLTPDGRFGVLDFGAVAHLPDGLPPIIGTLLRIALTGDAEAVLDGLREEGFVKASTKVDAQALLDFLDPFAAPARTDSSTTAGNGCGGSSPGSTTRATPTSRSG